MTLTPHQFIASIRPFADHTQHFYQWVLGEYVESQFKLAPGAQGQDWQELGNISMPADLKALLTLSNGLSLFIGTKYPGTTIRLYSTAEIAAAQQPQLPGIPFMYLQDNGELYYRVTSATPEIIIPYARLRLKLDLMRMLDYFMQTNGSDSWYASLDQKLISEY